MNALIINQSFPPTVAWKDEIEEYLLVSDDGFLPDPSNSQKRKKSFMIPTGFHLESTSGQSDWDKPGGTKKDIDHFVKSNTLLSGESQCNMEPPQFPAQKQLCPTAVFVNTEDREGAVENTVQLPVNGSYVDIQRHKNVKEMDYSTVKELNGDNILLQKDKSPGSMDIQRQEEDIPEDYSRVKEVDGENTVLLQRHNVSIDSSGCENSSHFTDCTSFTGPSKVGMCTELICSGYVDTIPAPSLMGSFVSHAMSINK